MNPPDPGAILSMWAGGMAAGVALVAVWKVARPGFILLGTGVAAVIGFLAALAGSGWWAAVAGLVSLLAIYLRSNRWAAVPLAGAALFWVEAAHPAWSWLVIVSGAIALGAITSEMLLGHWYLVDPRLPRWPLKILAAIGAVAIAVDTVLVQSLMVDSSIISPFVLIGLGVTSVILMVGVWFSLKVASYTGVMAATGLSYLAILTAVGGVVLGRALI